MAGRLRDQLAAKDRLAWAEQECQAVLRRPRGPQNPDTAWWRLREGRSLRGKARGVAQAVAAWRERGGMGPDSPARLGLPGRGLPSTARKPPNGPAALSDGGGSAGR